MYSIDGRTVFVLDKEVRLTRFDAIADSLLSATQPLASETPSVARIEVDEDSDDGVVIRRHLRRVKPDEPDEPDEPKESRELDKLDELDRRDPKYALEDDLEEGIPTEDTPMSYEPQPSLKVGGSFIK